MLSLISTSSLKHSRQSSACIFTASSSALLALYTTSLQNLTSSKISLWLSKSKDVLDISHSWMVHILYPFKPSLVSETILCSFWKHCAPMIINASWSLPYRLAPKYSTLTTQLCSLNLLAGANAIFVSTIILNGMNQKSLSFYELMLKIQSLLFFNKFL